MDLNSCDNSDVAASRNDVMLRIVMLLTLLRNIRSDVMCSASRAKRTSLPKETSRTKCASRSAQAEHIVPNKRALLSQCFLFDAC